MASWRRSSVNLRGGSSEVAKVPRRIGQGAVTRFHEGLPPVWSRVGQDAVRLNMRVFHMRILRKSANGLCCQQALQTGETQHPPPRVMLAIRRARRGPLSYRAAGSHPARSLRGSRRRRRPRRGHASWQPRSSRSAVKRMVGRCSGPRGEVFHIAIRDLCPRPVGSRCWG